jgi:hypothetical protein
MIIRYFDSLGELVSVVCRDLKELHRRYGYVYVGRVFGVKRYSASSVELADWDWEVVPYCSKVRDRLSLKTRKPILAFVRTGHRSDEHTMFYVYFNPQFFSNNEVEEIINEFNEMIKLYGFAIKMRSG